MRLTVLFSIVFVFVFALGAQSAKIDLSRLLVFYPCDETSGEILKDASGNGWDASAPGAIWEKGVFGNALRLKKSNTEVKGNIIGSTSKTGEISIMCWFNMSAHSTYNGLVSMSNPSCDASCCYRLMINPAKQPFWNAGRHSDKSLANFTFELNRWYHYAMVVDKRATKIFVDGKFIGEVVENFPPPKFDEVTLYVGTGEKPGTWTVENMAFDEVMVWDKVFDENEMKLIMEGSKVFTAVKSQGKLATTWAEVKR